MPLFSEETWKNFTYTLIWETFQHFAVDLGIENIFTLWNRTESELISFKGNFLKKEPTVKFALTYSKTKIIFLDTKIYKNQNGMLCTTI